MNTLLENIRIADILDIVVISIVVYLVLGWLRKRTSRTATLSLFLLAGLYVGAHVLGMYLTLSVFRVGLTVVLIALVIVFQQDIRRGFEQLSVGGLFGGSPTSVSVNTVDTLLETINTLAKEKIGALLVIRGLQPFEQHIRGGIPVGARISLPLLHSIFHPASQGHDGAVLIEGNVIEKLGVHLPLSNNLAEVGRTGTRHAAALGLAECCDALVVAISEERGTISVAANSRLKQVESLLELKSEFEKYYEREKSDPEERHVTHWPTANIGMKLLAASIAFGLWIGLVYDDETIQRTFPDVPIEFRKLPEGWGLQETLPTAVDVTLSGSEQAFSAFEPTSLKASIDLSDVRGEAAVTITEEHFDLPTGFSIEHVSPSVVQVRSERLISVSLPVHVVFAEPGVAQKRGLVARSNPPTVRVLIPESKRASSREVKTEPIPSSAIAKNQTANVKLVQPPDVKFAAGSAPQVTIQFEGNSPKER